MPQARRAPALGACALLAAAALAAPAGAQIYKWTDEKGVVHLSQDPPPKAALQELPETTHAPLVKNGPPPIAEAVEPEDAREPRAVAPAPEEHAVDVGPDGDGSPDVIVVDGGGSDLATRYRANSPRNRPGEPIRQPGQSQLGPRQPGPGGSGPRQPRRAR